MGTGSGGSRGDLTAIKAMFAREFENFKNDKEVIRTMTIMEEKYAEGKAEAEAAYTAKVEKLIADKIRIGENLAAVKELAAELGISDKRFNELQAANK